MWKNKIQYNKILRKIKQNAPGGPVSSRGTSLDEPGEWEDQGR